MDNDRAEALRKMEEERALAENYYAAMARSLNDLEFAGLLHAVMKERKARLAKLEAEAPGIASLVQEFVEQQRRGVPPTNPDF